MFLPAVSCRVIFLRWQRFGGGEFLGGTTGELTWTLTEDGVLTITGEGPMPDYRDGGTSETPPWYPHVNRISSLTIGEGVTRIGDYAFMLCSFVTEVVIPESVTSMGDWAFYGYLDMAVVTCLAVIPPELGKDNFGFPAKNSLCTCRQCGGVQEKCCLERGF